MLANKPKMDTNWAVYLHFIYDMTHTAIQNIDINCDIGWSLKQKKTLILKKAFQNICQYLKTRSKYLSDEAISLILLFG